MEQKRNQKEKGIVWLDKIYGGLTMDWKTVILFALAAAVLSAVVLIVPVFQNTSFERIGVHYEAWFFFAILIMANCKTPLESALKTFVFFLVSQPLICLFQVPFSSMGWLIFLYYRHWFMVTLLTFPMAYIGWYIPKKNRWSVVILLPVLAFMSMTAYTCGAFALRHFPRMLLAALFCIAQIVIYLVVFVPDLKKKVIGILAALAGVLMAAFLLKNMISAAVFLPDDPVFSEKAVVMTEDDAFADVTILSTGLDSTIRVDADRTGTMDFTISDQGREYHYNLRVYEDIEGNLQVEITVKGQ